MFANFYLSPLDHFVKHDLGIKAYGRYVDDFFLVHESKEYLKECRRRIEGFISSLGLELSPKKVYLQPVSHGVTFLGVNIQPGHINISKRTARHFIECASELNSCAYDHRPTHMEMKAFRSRLNSYLGILGHYDTYRLRRRVLDGIDQRVMRRFHVARNCRKVSV